MKNLYLFDCFGVVVTDVSTLWMNTRLNGEQQQYARKVLFRKTDCGQISFDECMAELAKTCNLPVSEMQAEWDSFARPMPETLQLIRLLRAQGHTVALLSNASVEYVDRLFTQFDLYGYFDKIFVSARYGYAKPDREFYEICLNSFSEKFDKIYFTDDNEMNLRNIETLGITPVLFTDAAHLKMDLEVK